MIDENILVDPEWVKALNTYGIILLAILLAASFTRTFIVCWKMRKINERKKPFDDISIKYNLRLFFLLVLSEILTYLYFCIVFNIWFSNYPTMTIINGLSIVVWDSKSWLYGVVGYIIGIIIWLILSVVLTFSFTFLGVKVKIGIKDKLKISFNTILFSIPFYLFVQLYMILSVPHV